MADEKTDMIEKATEMTKETAEAVADGNPTKAFAAGVAAGATIAIVAVQTGAEVAKDQAN